ncbi:MAG: DUF362 domain-containing protein [Desulfocucumaceae bacterium]
MTVFVKRCASYEQDVVQEAVIYLLERAGGIKKLVKPGQLVALKVNLIARKKPDNSVTTHPSLVEAVAREVIKAGGRPVICDSPGGPYTKGLLKSIYRETGMEEVARKTGAELNYDTGEEIIKFPEGIVYKSYPIISPLARADVIIGLSKMKTHGMTTYTGAVKLFYGAIPGLKKAEYHFNLQRLQDFSQLLVDVTVLLKPHLSIIDGIWGMEGNGPVSGTPRFAGVLMASENPFSLDAAACRLMGISPAKIIHLKVAAGRGLVGDLNSVQVEGDSPEVADPPFKLPGHKNIDFNLPPTIKKLLGRWFQPRPVFSGEICAGCGDCARACPSAAIEINSGKAGVNLEKCIRCFCCQELCLHRAVSVYQWWPAKKFLR